jgi:hypothetical protein
LRDTTEFISAGRADPVVQLVGSAGHGHAAAELPGLEAIRRIAAGELPPPPIAELLGFEITLVEPGRVIFAIEPAEWI